MEPDRSLKAHRAVDDGAPGKGCMGMQLCPLFADASAGREEELETWIGVGMTIEVVERGSHFYLVQ